MEAVIFIGLQGSGKSSFYWERYFDTHVRISLDLLRTRHRERRLLELCLETQMPFVVDNTNPTEIERLRYLQPALSASYSTIGIYFPTPLEECLQRNSFRKNTARVPDIALYATAKKLQRPSSSEGFHTLSVAQLTPTGFIVEDWKDDL